MPGNIKKAESEICRRKETDYEKKNSRNSFWEVLLTAAFSGCGTNKATEAAKTSADIESGKDDEVENAEEPEEEEEKPHGTVGVCLPSEETDEREAADAQKLQESFAEAGYETCFVGRQ